jgi:CPA2 family monovalent cation:H+ antiporter-2
MEGHFDLTGLAAVALVAMVCGMLLARLKQPAIVGYILAGIVLGPSVLGLVSSREHVDILAELGVLLLLFTIGMTMSLRAFRQIWRVAFLCTLMQICGSVAVMLAISRLLGWSPGVGVFFGFILAISSTAVAIKILEEIGELRTRIGQIAVGVLIAQDMAVVPMLLIVGDLAGGALDLWVPLKVAASVLILALIVWYLSRRERVSLPFGGVIASNTDLAPLMGLVYCFGGAAVSGLIGLSPAYGAFLAGLVIGNSAERAPMIQMVHPIQSVLMMVFFLSIGLLLDLNYIWRNLGIVVLLIAVVTLFKTALNIGLLRLLRQPWTHAFIAGLSLSQLGEFTFLLAQAGSQTALIADADYRLIIAVTVMSLVISPFWLNLMRRIEGVTVPHMASLGDLVQVVYGREIAAAWGRYGAGPFNAASLALWRGGGLMAAVLRRAARRDAADTDTTVADPEPTAAPQPRPAKPKRHRSRSARRPAKSGGARKG